MDTLPFTAEDIARLTGTATAFLGALSLASARVFGLALVLPVFTRMGLTGLLRGGVVLALSLPLTPYLVVQMQAFGPIGAGELLGLVLKETFLGLVLGLAYGVPFWAAEAAGDVIDTQRGSAAAYLVDPSSQEEASVTGTLFVVAMLALFFVHDGFQTVVDGLFTSYAVWPALTFTPRLTGETAWLFLHMLDEVMRLALLLAGPLLIAMFMGEAALAFVARFAPQLNVFDLSLSVKSAILVCLLPVYAAFLLDNFKADLAPLRHVMDQLRPYFG